MTEEEEFIAAYMLLESRVRRKQKDLGDMIYEAMMKEEIKDEWENCYNG
jgi:hypothetical protein